MCACVFMRIVYALCVGLLGCDCGVSFIVCLSVFLRVACAVCWVLVCRRLLAPSRVLCTCLASLVPSVGVFCFSSLCLSSVIPHGLP